MSNNFYRGIKFALPISLILWALFVWLALVVFNGAQAAERAREIFSERRTGHPGQWKKVHLTFDELALILLLTLNESRNNQELGK